MRRTLLVTLIGLLVAAAYAQSDYDRVVSGIFDRSNTVVHDCDSMFGGRYREFHSTAAAIEGFTGLWCGRGQMPFDVFQSVLSVFLMSVDPIYQQPWEAGPHSTYTKIVAVSETEAYLIRYESLGEYDSVIMVAKVQG